MAPMNRLLVRRIAPPSMTRSFADVELLKMLGLEREAKAGFFVVQLQETVLRHRLTVKNIVEQFVTHLDLVHREILADRAGQSAHSQMVIMHLASVRNHRNAVSLAQGIYLVRHRNAPDSISVVLRH